MTETSNLYLCIKQFNSRLGDELNLKVGDKIQVLADDSEYNDGWYMGKNLSTGKVGLYPKSFTQVLVEENSAEPSLLRSRSRSRRLNSGSMQSSAENSPIAKQFEKLSLNGISSRAPSGPSHNDYDTLTDNDKSNDFNDTDNINDLAVNKTMNDIDRALKELQSDSFTPSHQRKASNLSLTEDLNPKDALKWTPKQVTSYFALGLGFDTNVAGKFARHKITGAILFELDLNHLKELDIDSFGTRFEIHREIENLKKIVYAQNDTPSSPAPVAAPKSLSSTPTVETRGSPAPSSPATTTIREEPRLMRSAEFSHQRKKSQSYDNLGDLFKSPNLDKGYQFGNDDDGEIVNPYARKSNGNQALSRPSSSIYDQSVHSRNHSRNPSRNLTDPNTHHRRNSSVISANMSQPVQHRRHSSFFSFISRDKEEEEIKSPKKQEKLISPVKIKKQPVGEMPETPEVNKPVNLEEIDIDSAQFSPRKSKSINYKYEDIKPVVDTKRSVSDSNNSSSTSTPKNGTVSRFKTLRTASTNNFKSLTSSKKLKTSAFQEGIRNITPDEAIKTANYSGFMSKKSGSNLSWRSRYFTLHGTRLLYFTSLKDKKEKGLIDITAHKVIPITSDGEDKYVALYAASTGLGRYCFKLMPPAPGFKKGLTFTQPKVHFFAVETQEEMRGWLKALMTATIDIDDSVPVVSSCSTPTVSLSKAQEMLAKAREETKLKDEQLRARGLNNGGAFLGEFDNYGDDDNFNEAQLTSFIGNYTLDPNTSGENSPLVESSMEEQQLQGPYGGFQSPSYAGFNSPTPSDQPKLSIDTSRKTSVKGPTTPQLSGSHKSGGFASPYLLASGLLSPKAGNGSTSNLSPTLNVGNDNDTSLTNYSMNSKLSNSNTTTPNDQKNQYFPDTESGELTPKLNSSNSKVLVSNSQGAIHSGKKKRNSEKMLAYSNDGSGNHTFVIKLKRQ